jgi:hypothetical protein
MKCVILIILIATYAISAICQGELNYQFNDGGYLNMDVQGTFDIVGGITERPDGNYIVASYSGENQIADDYVIVSCIDTFGIVCPLFANNGHFVLAPPNGVNAVFQYIQNNEDNSVLFGWRSSNEFNESGFLLLDSDGVPVNEFGIGGIQYVDEDLGDAYFWPNEFLKNPSGGYLLAGYVYESDTESFHPAMQFLTEECIPDINYGINGLIEYEELTDVDINSACFNSENEILMAGSKIISDTERYPVIVKCNSEGIVVTEFGESGLVTFDNGEYPPNTIITSIKEFATVGYTLLMYSSSVSGIARVNEACEFIPTFAFTGDYEGFCEFTGDLDGSYADVLIQQQDGKILSAYPDSNELLSVLKVAGGSGNFDGSFGFSGVFYSDFGQGDGALFPLIYLLENGHVLGGFTRQDNFSLTIFELTNIDLGPMISVDELNEFTATPYPNPFNEYFQVKAEDVCKMTVSSIQGTKLFESTLDRGLSKVETSDWSSGIYLVSITEQSKTYLVRIVKV